MHGYPQFPFCISIIATDTCKVFFSHKPINHAKTPSATSKINLLLGPFQDVQKDTPSFKEIQQSSSMHLPQEILKCPFQTLYSLPI